MQGWSWGPGAVNAAYPPPNLSFENVCTSPETEDVTPTPLPTATFLPAVPAVTTTTEFPVESATAVPLPEDSPSLASPDLEPTASTNATIAGQPAVPTRDLKAVETSLPSPTLSSSLASTEFAQPTPDTVSVLASVSGSIPTRQGQQDTNKRVEISTDPPKSLSVVGQGVEVPDLRALPLMGGSER